MISLVMLLLKADPVDLADLILTVRISETYSEIYSEISSEAEGHVAAQEVALLREPICVPA